MSEAIRIWTAKVREKFQFAPGKVLDVGSLNVNGSVRDLFTDAEEYVGIDFREGAEVDHVVNAHNLCQFFDWSLFDTVVCMNMFEHDEAFWITLEEINTLLKPGGHFLVAMPTFGFPIHEHPQDFWRAGEDAFKKVIFKGYDILDIQTVYTKEHEGKPINPILCAIGKKHENSDIPSEG